MKQDTQLQHDVLAQLEWESSLDASQIGVAAKDHVVTLTGTVSSLADKFRAERVVKGVYGVQGVANDITVKIPGSRQRTDADIATAALDALRWDSEVPEDKIKVTVRDGWVTLDGQVEWQYERTTAERDVRRLIGVHGVTNQLEVRPRVSSTDVKTKIEAAFKRSAEIDARRVSVEANDGKVILRGNVRSWPERDEAQQAAWSAPGVAEVENLISVVP